MRTPAGPSGPPGADRQQVPSRIASHGHGSGGTAAAGGGHALEPVLTPRPAGIHFDELSRNNRDCYGFMPAPTPHARGHGGAKRRLGPACGTARQPRPGTRGQDGTPGRLPDVDMGGLSRGGLGHGDVGTPSASTAATACSTTGTGRTVSYLKEPVIRVAWRVTLGAPWPCASHAP